MASATAIVCLQIAWVVAWQLLLPGERFNVGVTVGLAVSFAGVLVVRSRLHLVHTGIGR